MKYLKLLLVFWLLRAFKYDGDDGIIEDRWTDNGLVLFWFLISKEPVLSEASGTNAIS